jgi:hypothetical protein
MAWFGFTVPHHGRVTGNRLREILSVASGPALFLWPYRQNLQAANPHTWSSSGCHHLIPCCKINHFYPHPHYMDTQGSLLSMYTRPDLEVQNQWSLTSTTTLSLMMSIHRDKYISPQITEQHMQTDVVVWDLKFSKLLNIKITVFWNVALCRLADRYQQFEGTPCLHLQSENAEIFPPETSVSIWFTARNHIP